MAKKKDKPPNEDLLGIMKKFKGDPSKPFTGMGFITEKKKKVK